MKEDFREGSNQCEFEEVNGEGVRLELGFSRGKLKVGEDWKVILGWVQVEGEVVCFAYLYL